jgi:hypothetical protein
VFVVEEGFGYSASSDKSRGGSRRSPGRHRGYLIEIISIIVARARLTVKIVSHAQKYIG